jgi:galactokinase
MKLMLLKDRITEEFARQFGEQPSFIVRAPGRVNLIGEHTDYNEGFVLPIAIDRAVWLALSPRSDDRVLVHSLEDPNPTEFSLNRLEYANEGWAEYVRGMAKMLGDAGHRLTGWRGVLTSDVPIGSGLSSSAALEMAVGLAFAAASDFSFDGVEMARLGQKAENDWVGANTGVMDQMISANGKAGFALLIDCRDLSMQPIPLPKECAILVLDTMTRHDHRSSGYNERRESCERGAELLGFRHLRDLGMEEFLDRASELDDECMRRVRHVLSENDRVLASVSAMRAGDASTLGQLMNASHASLRDDFEVTNAQLDAMARIAQAQPGCFGARMTGGGFGGCAVALIERDRAEEIGAAIGRQFEAETDLRPDVFATRAEDGVALV